MLEVSEALSFVWYGSRLSTTLAPITAGTNVGLRAGTSPTTHVADVTQHGHRQEMPKGESRSFAEAASPRRDDVTEGLPAS